MSVLGVKEIEDIIALQEQLLLQAVYLKNWSDAHEHETIIHTLKVVIGAKT